MRPSVWTKLVACLCCLAVGLQGADGRRRKNATKSPPPMVRNLHILNTVLSRSLEDARHFSIAKYNCAMN